MNPSPRGFTVVEMTVVLVVMGLIATFALPRLMDRRSLHERAFRDSLQSLLRDARRVAFTQQRDVCVQLAGGATPWAELRYFGTACNGAPVEEPGTSQPYRVDLPQGVTWTGATLVRFNTSGQPVPNANQTLTVGTGTLIVTRETGYAYQP
jgi:MSHA pilin protein MshC